MNRITEVTRLRIFDGLIRDGITWFGRLGDLKFLRRLYDLQALPSEDSRFETAERDIVQHRFNNPGDWESDWIFEDPRFGLADGPDEVLLAFLTEMLHPVVRTSADDVDRILTMFNTALVHDGYEIVQTGQISGAPVFGWQQNDTELNASEEVDVEFAPYGDSSPVIEVATDEVDVLITRYGRATDAYEPDSLETVVSILRDHLTLAGWSVRGIRMGLLSESRALGIESDGTSYIVEVLWPTAPVGPDAVWHIVHAAEERVSRLPCIVLCMAGYTDDAVEGAAGRTSGECIFLDATHLEAALCQLLTAREIFGEALRELRFENRAFVSLTDLLTQSAPPPARMHTPDKRPEPWPITRSLAPDVEATVALVAEPGWGQPSGMARGLPGHVVVTVDAGVVDIDTRRGTASWLVYAPGCHGPAMIMPNDRLLVMCRGAVLEVSGADMRAIGGGFDRSATLLHGDDGEVWVLSGAHRVSNYGDEVPLSLWADPRDVDTGFHAARF